MENQNGGIPLRTCHRTAERTSWAKDHVYPDIGVYFADCPSAGHDMLCLDYRDCGPTGEPKVVHVDQDRDYKITLVAPTFESFIRGLQREEDFDGS